MGFFGDLFGGKSGMAAANQAAAAQTSYTNEGYGKQRENLTGGYSQADTILSGYEKPGQQAYSQYADSIGVNGQQGYQNAIKNFNDDPFAAGANEAARLGTRSISRRYNPTGQQGAEYAATARYNAEAYNQRVADYRNRLMGLGQQGAQFGTARAGNAVSQGQEVGQSYLGQNNQLGSIEANRLSGIQQARTGGMNNLMSGIGAIAGIAAAPFTGGASLGVTASSLGRMGGGGGGQNALMSGYGAQGSGYVPSYSGGSYNTGYSKNFGWGA